jgi:hypothetical protein
MNIPNLPREKLTTSKAPTVHIIAIFSAASIDHGSPMAPDLALEQE